MNNLSELLLEAVELLNEGARYRKDIKDKDGNSPHSSGRKAAKAMAKYKDSVEELRKAAARMKYYSSSSRPHRGRKTYVSMSKEEKEQMYNDALTKSAIAYSKYNENKELGKKLSDYNKNKLDRKMALITKRNNKSQNESIAVLLTEAAEILNEGAKNRKEYKDPNGDTSHSAGRRAAKKIAKGNYCDATSDIIKGMAIKNDNIINQRNSDKKHIYAKKILNNSASKKDKEHYLKLIDSDSLHNKISNRGKSQNESIIALLTEAVEILKD